MSLDTRKQQRLLANRAAIRTGRTLTVAAVYRTQYGGHTAVAVDLILKQQGTSNPLTVDQISTGANEYLAELDIAFNPRPVAYFALTGGALDEASLAAAILLEVLAYRQSGLIPNRWQLTLRRFR